MNNLLGILVSIIFIAVIMISARLFEKSGKEASRKYIHIMLSNWWIIAMIFFDNMWSAAILPAIFVIINYLSYKMNLIKVMEREEGEENKDSLGTVYYAITLLVLALITFGPLHNPIIGLCGVIVMGYGDGLAAVIGETIKSPEFKIGNRKKTVAGSLTMFIITMIILMGFLQYSGSDFWGMKAIVVAVIATVIEAVSIRGTDNITVPLITSLLAYFIV